MIGSELNDEGPAFYFIMGLTLTGIEDEIEDIQFTIDEEIIEIGSFKVNVSQWEALPLRTLFLRLEDSVTERLKSCRSFVFSLNEGRRFRFSSSDRSVLRDFLSRSREEKQ